MTSFVVDISSLQMTRRRAIQSRTKLANTVSCIDSVLRGSLLQRLVRHSSGCPKCARGEGHPLWVLNVNYPGGKTRQVSLRPEQVPLVRESLDNYHRIRQTLEAISEINQQLLLLDRAATSLPNSGGVAGVAGAPTGLRALPEGFLAVRFTAGALAVADSVVWPETPPADPARSFLGIGHARPSLPLPAVNFWRAGVGQFSRAPKVLLAAGTNRAVIRNYAAAESTRHRSGPSSCRVPARAPVAGCPPAALPILAPPGFRAEQFNRPRYSPWPPIRHVAASATPPSALVPVWWRRNRQFPGRFHRPLVHHTQ